jgi:zinc/manganese transport system substrate-binding protein
MQSAERALPSDPPVTGSTKETHAMMRMLPPSIHRAVVVGSVTILVALVGSACSSATPASAGAHGGAIVAVGAENEYGVVIAQIGGRYVDVDSILDNPNTDPHTFESSPSVVRAVGAAQLVVQNGVGYDTFMTTIENATPDGRRKVIDVQHLLGLPDSTPNPHLWYGPATMPAVARAVSAALASLDPAHAGYFRARLAVFQKSLGPWTRAIAQFKATFPDTPVATTEPVADYMLEAAGTRDLTPFALQAAIMNGTDPAPEDVSIEESLFTGHKVKVFLYNEQVTDPLTQTFLALARHNGIPVVGVYETMPTPGFTYQSWMLAELHALERAVADKSSTDRL